MTCGREEGSNPTVWATRAWRPEPADPKCVRVPLRPWAVGLDFVFIAEIHYRELRSRLSYPFRTHGDAEVLSSRGTIHGFRLWWFESVRSVTTWGA
jgi:hypothetical protein